VHGAGSHPVLVTALRTVVVVAHIEVWPAPIAHWHSQSGGRDDGRPEPEGVVMRSRLQWIHGRGERVVVERKQTYAAEIFVKLLVLAGLLYMPVLILQGGEWIPFAGTSIYLLWELGRINSALGELAGLWNAQYQQRQESARSDSLQ
jgi:hypothetical protein